MKTLSGRQPWWWAILTKDLPSPKRIENRTWNTHYRGPVLLHAAKGCTLAEWGDAVGWMVRAGVAVYGQVPELRTAAGLDVGAPGSQRGGIVGRACIVDVVPPVGPGLALEMMGANYHGADPRWHMTEQFGWILQDVEPLPFYPCKGMLGLWEFDESLLKGAA